jgi:hypothetical protein
MMSMEPSSWHSLKCSLTEGSPCKEMKRESLFILHYYMHTHFTLHITLLHAYSLHTSYYIITCTLACIFYVHRLTPHSSDYMTCTHSLASLHIITLLATTHLHIITLHAHTRFHIITLHYISPACSECSREWKHWESKQ